LDGQDLAGPGLGDRPAKRRKAEVAEVQLLQIIKKHSGSRLANQPSPLWGLWGVSHGEAHTKRYWDVKNG
jgi:hypothetical protein